MRIPKPIILFRAPLQPVQVLCSGRGGKIDVPYIRCLDGRVPEAYELWDIAEDEFCEVHPYNRVRLLYEFREDTFHTHFFNLQRFQIPFLCRRAVNDSVKFLDVVYTTQHVQIRVDYTPNIFIQSWGVNRINMSPPNVSTITRCAYNLPVTLHGLVLRSNHKILILKRIEFKRIRVEEYLARIRQEISDKVASNVSAPVNNVLGDALSDDSNSDDVWLDRYDYE